MTKSKQTNDGIRATIITNTEINPEYDKGNSRGFWKGLFFGFVIGIIIGCKLQIWRVI